MYYLYGKSNSRDALIQVYSNLNIFVKDKDNDGRILTLEATIDGSISILKTCKESLFIRPL